jgi:aminomethyltransferase
MQGLFMSSIKLTSLYPEHEALQAKFVEFHGWKMPLHYGSAIAEHMAVRKHAGLFDVSHMTIVDMIGAGGRHFLRRLMTRDVDEIKHPDGACYSCMCNEQGGVIDDVLIYYRQPDNYRLIFNAATKTRVLEWLNTHSKGYSIGFQIRHDLSMIAIQGPEAIQKVMSIVSPYQMDVLSTLKRFNSIEDQQIFFSRTGYTGEDGLEIILPAQHAIEMWQKLIQAGVQPCGLAARDSLRLEAGLMLNGQDMDEHISPLECGLDWTISWKAHDREFIGKPSLIQQQEENQYPRLVGLALDAQAILRHGQAVTAYGQSVGHITSGIFSPLLKKSVAFARINADAQTKPLNVEIRGKQYPVETHSTRFYSPNKK